MTSAATELLVRRFEACAAAAPDAVAVQFDQSACTYAELNAVANGIAARLLESGVRSGDLVAVLLEPSIEQIAALIAVMKSGAAYVPLDPAYPRERLQAIVDQAQPQALLTVAAANFAGHSLPALLLDDAMMGGAATNPDVTIARDDLCYLMYTSGSTGVPNGVMVTHGNIAGLFENVQVDLELSSADCWSALHSFAFGFSVWEIWGALSTGARLVIVPAGMRNDPVAWSQQLAAAAVTILSVTPSAFRQWMYSMASESSPAVTGLRLIVFSGEVVRTDDLAEWFDRYGDTGPRLINTYALTETAGRVTCSTTGRIMTGSRTALVTPRPMLNRSCWTRTPVRHWPLAR